MNRTDRLALTLTVLESRELDAFVATLPAPLAFPWGSDDEWDLSDYYHSANKWEAAVDAKTKEIIARRELEVL